MDSNKLKLRLDDISEVNPALTCYHIDDPAPVLPLREEPDLLSWLENTGRLVAEKDGDSQEISTISTLDPNYHQLTNLAIHQFHLL